MLIVEGPDGAGKTSLIRRLSADLRWPVAPKVVASDTTPMVNLGAWVDANTQQGFQRKIFDRHRLISEPIYGPSTRSQQDQNFLDLGWVAEMNWRFYTAKPILIYCIPSLETVRRNVINDPNNAAIAKRITAIYSSYVTRASVDFTSASTSAKLYNYETTLYEDVLNWTRRELMSRGIGKKEQSEQHV
jgi:hypothetical protein